jgi:hypothetical protein
MAKKPTHMAKAKMETTPLDNSGTTPPAHERIALVAYLHWQSRGCPEESAEIDWFQAERELQQATAK